MSLVKTGQKFTVKAACQVGRLRLGRGVQARFCSVLSEAILTETQIRSSTQWGSCSVPGVDARFCEAAPLLFVFALGTWPVGS